MATPKTGVLQDPIYRRHLTGEGHPESPRRCDAVRAALASTPFADRLVPVAPREAADEEILLAHSREYLDTVRRDVASGAGGLSTGDTVVSPESLTVARKAVGGVLEMVDAVYDGRVRNGFCAVRPPGHHASRSRGMGFCIFNNVAIAARYARGKHKAERVAIVDWDVHHGNGTQDIFWEDGHVLFFSTHQWPLYPGTGAAGETGRGAGRGLTLNVPLPAGSGMAEIGEAFRRLWRPAVHRFKPDLVLVSAGFDSRREDPLGGFRLSDEDFAALTKIVMDVAEQHAGRRVVSVLEGGYSLAGLASAVAAHVGALTAN